MSEHDASTAAALAAGRPGRALRLATEPGALEGELDALDRFIGAGGGGAEGALRAAAPVDRGCRSGDRADRRGARAGADHARRMGVVRARRCVLRLGRTRARGLEGLPPRAGGAGREDLDLTRIVEILARILETAESVAIYAQPRLAFEALMLDIFAGPNSPPLRGGGVPRGAGGQRRRRSTRKATPIPSSAAGMIHGLLAAIEERR